MTYEPPNHIAVLNKSTTLDDTTAQLWVEAYREEVKRVAEAWQIAPPGIALYPSTHTEEPDPAVFGLYVVDTAGDPDALGYHTVAGRSRFGYVDMSLSAAYDIPSVVFGHELFEGLIDADLDRWVLVPNDNRPWYIPVEVSDPPQRDSYQVTATAFGSSSPVHIADWVYPTWFQPGSMGPYDYLGRIYHPLEDAPGGYHVVAMGSAVWATGGRMKNFGRTHRRLLKGRPQNV